MRCVDVTAADLTAADATAADVMAADVMAMAETWQATPGRLRGDAFDCFARARHDGRPVQPSAEIDKNDLISTPDRVQSPRAKLPHDSRFRLRPRRAHRAARDRRGAA